MSRGGAGDELLFAKIGDKKISGSQSAGYRMNHFVEKGILFLAFWIMSKIMLLSILASIL